MANIKHAVVARSAPFSAIVTRVEAIDWAQVTADLDGQGCAVLKRLLSPEECRALAALYPDDARFRSRIVMGRHGFGRGEYKYRCRIRSPNCARRSMRGCAASPIAGTRRWGSISAIPTGTRRS